MWHLRPNALHQHVRIPTPVSYTHLDVYKRQERSNNNNEHLPYSETEIAVEDVKDDNITYLILTEYTKGDKTIPVSYTHLDVYKRQTPTCAHTHTDQKTLKMAWR